MSFAQTHDTLWYSPKFRKLTFAARGLWVTCQSWCIGQLTDGLIPESAVKDIGGTEPQIRALMSSGLWEVAETKDGERAYQFHDWLVHNQSAAQISTRKRSEQERSASRRGGSKKKRDEESPTDSEENPSAIQYESGRDSTSIHPESESIFTSGTPSDLGGSEDDRAVIERKRKKDKHKREPARPPGGSPSATETEAKVEGEGEEPKKSPILSNPHFDPGTIGPRLSALSKGSAEVDVSAQEADPFGEDYNYEPFTNPTEELKGSTESTPLEQMTPKELLDYIEAFQREVNGLPQDGGPAGVATMKCFQESYGAETAAAIIRELFVKREGRYKITKEVEPISYKHFSKTLRPVFMDKLALKVRDKAKDEAYVKENFIFSSELW